MFRVLYIYVLCFCQLTAAEKPNIIWITSEDNSMHWLGCYGNQEAKTPHIDQLATNGIQFQHAYSNAPVCAVARSTILTGVHAITQGTQHMRSRHPISKNFIPYVHHLKQHGYYCTNNSKTDYNFQIDDKSIWDKCSKTAHYNSRPNNAPFFSIFNLTRSHESSLFRERIASNRKNSRIPKQPRIAPDQVKVPPYLPNLPEIRQDIAIYHDTITALDQEIGSILKELKQQGLAEDTIIFYYSDHGGILPRGKRYIKETGVHVPMIVHIPEKWQHLSPFKPGDKVEEIISFVDLAPTLLSLLGQEKPNYMQGRAFLGSKRTTPPENNYALLYADRFDEIYGMRRGITDGKWKYIRRFTPHLSAAPYSYYQFSQAGWSAWQQAWKDDKLTGRFKTIWEPHQPSEELYNLESDPWEINNLAGKSAHSSKLQTLRNTLKSKMIKTRDTGLIPEAMFAELSPNKPMANYLQEHVQMLPALANLAFTASSKDPKHLEKLMAHTKSSAPLTRYWALQGLLALGQSAQPAEASLDTLKVDPISAIRVSTALVYSNLGKGDICRQILLEEISKDLTEYQMLYLINAFKQTNNLEQVPQQWVNKTLANPKAGKYLTRFAQLIAKQRK